MGKLTLNLGAILSDIIKNANSNFTELYDAISVIEEKQADDGEKAVVYSTVEKMISGLNAGNDEAGNALDITVGDEIYILDEDTPDFWVSAVSTSSSTGSKPTTWEKNTNYVFGKYTIRVSKSREIDLTQYQLITNLVTSLSATSTDSTYPSAKAVYNAIEALRSALTTEIGKKVDTSTYNAKVSNLESGISTAVSTANTAKTNAETANSEITKIKDGTTVVKKAEQDGSGNNIADTYATKEEVSSAINGVHSHDNKDVIDKFAETDGKVTYDGNELGKVQGVALNGTEITLDADGIANINVADLESVYITKDSEYWTTCPTNNLPALRVNATDTTLEMLNANGEAVVAQVVKYGDYLYYCVAETMTCTFRRIGGNAVSGGSVDISSLEAKIEALENKKLYQHNVTFSASGISISSINYGDNHTMTRSGSIESATIVRLARNNDSLTNNNIVTMLDEPISIKGFLKITMSMTDFSNVIHCPIKSISKETSGSTNYTIVYIDNKTAYTSAGDPILVSEEVSVEVPIENVSVINDRIREIRW